MLTIWPIRGWETVSGWCWIMEIWSKVKVTLTILRRKQVLFSPGGAALVFFSEICVEGRCALDSILVNLNKTISRFRAMFVLAGHNRSELVWFPGLSLVTRTQGMPLIGCWWHGQTVTADDPIIWFLSPDNSPSPLIPIPVHCAAWALSYLHIFVFVGISWLEPDITSLSSVTQIRGDCEKRSRGHVTFYSNNLVHHQHNIPGSRWKMISEI